MSPGRRTDKFHGRVENAGRECDHPECSQAGEFRAPPRQNGRRDGPPNWLWFCLEHVREFNRGYNFFEGMSADEIYEAQRPISGWEDETRAFSGVGAKPRWEDFSDPLDAIGARFQESLDARRKAREAEASRATPLSPQDQTALKTLGLQADADRIAIRRAYSQRLRQYHPDRNGGDRRHEAKLQRVVEAYKWLKKSSSFG